MQVYPGTDVKAELKRTLEYIISIDFNLREAWRKLDNW